jgi:AcrR family transcriptional regulator
VPERRGRAVEPVELLRLLWQPAGTGARRGPDRARTLAEVVAAGIAVADRGGVAAATMRAVAAALGVSTMSLYSHVPGKDALVALMVDRLYAQMPRPTTDGRTGREALRQVADLNRQLLLSHPWLADSSSARPPLGPGVLAKYEYELTAFAGLGLDDVTTDDCLTYLLTFVHGATRADLAARDHRRDSGTTDQEWWDQYQPLLAQVFDERRYPTATRVGTAAGTARGSAYDADQAYRFGLDRTLEAILTLVPPVLSPDG